MTDMQNVPQNKEVPAGFAESYARLQAVESVLSLMSGIDQAHDSSADIALNLPSVASLDSAFAQSHPAVRKKFEKSCLELAGIAQAGAQALLQLKSSGRSNISVAKNRLVSEVVLASDRAIGLLAA